MALNPEGLIAKYVATLPDRIDIGPPLHRTDDGRVAGRFLNARVSSVFQPIFDLSRQVVVGHQGLLRVDASGDSPLAPWNLFALAASDAMLQHLDRLCRTLHTLNYFADVDKSQSLFLNVEQRLLASVPRDHGKVFEGILARFDLSPRRVVIVFPRSVTGDPVLLRKAARNYRARGYRLLVPGTSWGDDFLRLVADAEIDLVKVDVAQGFNPDQLSAFGVALGENGVPLLVGRVESADLLKGIIEAGADLAQGFVLGTPAPLTRRQRCHTSLLMADAPRADQGRAGSTLV